MIEELIRPEMPASPPWPDVSPLHGHPISDELDVVGRLRWISDLLQRRQIAAGDESGAKYFDEIRARIERRHRETRLFLGVVGEFSSGKSTLINALVRYRLLRSDVLQGTTAAVTLIAFDERFTVTVRRKRKNAVVRAATALKNTALAVFGAFRQPKAPPGRDELIQLLHLATSDEHFARDVVQVDVTLPSQSLRDGMVIVDTPGINAQNPRHAEVTAGALRDACDAALVAVPADAAGAESLLRYLRAHAGDVLHRCIFVLTKADLLRRERDRILVMHNLKARLATELGIANPRVLAMAPQFVVESVPRDANGTLKPADLEGYTADEIERWNAQFCSMEDELRHLLREKRLQAQADDIGALLEGLYRRVKADLERHLQDYRARHEALERLIIPDIHGFIESERHGYDNRARQAAFKTIDSLVQDIEEIGAVIVNQLHAAIYEAKNRGELKNAMESVIPATVAGGETFIRKHVNNLLTKAEKAVQAEFNAFHESFQERYRSLATLGGRLSIDAAGPMLAFERFRASSAGISSDLAAGMRDDEDQRNHRMFGTGAAGAMIGTIMLPGLGTILGVLAGTLLGAMFGPSLDELKERCWQPLRDRIHAQLAAAAVDIPQAVQLSLTATLEAIGRAISDYAPRYELLVEQMRARDAREKDDIVAMQQAVTQDLASIDEQQALLAGIQKRIRSM
ncbi:MAG: dynamin family protein [Planctomycetes bacterium]|nr:dynamin family protein [Planctomycetota bacterium]